MIDTGCPFTLIDRTSARKLGLNLRETRSTITGVFGDTQRTAVSTLSTLAMGNCTFTHVPVQVADQGDLNRVRGEHLDGLFGAYEMAKFGMIIDCARQMIYVDPRPSAATAQKVAAFLQSRGFSRIPMHFNQEHHLEIAAAINGHPTRLIVDSGASTTLISSGAASESGVALSPLRIVEGTGSNFVPINLGHIHELTLGNLAIHNAEIVVAKAHKQVGAGLLGEEYLSFNFAIIDIGGMSLYLRPPDAR